MEKIIYDVDYFIKKAEYIIEEKWTTCYLLSDGKSCIMGHCGTTTKGMQSNPVDYVYTEEGDILINLFKLIDTTPWEVNDNECGNYKYNQPTPKQRILAALYDIKKLQQPTYTDITKQLAVIPVDEVSDNKFTKTLKTI